MQEVQSQWDTYQENHEIEQIGYSSRRISDKMQVRDRGASGISTDENYVSVNRNPNADPHSDYKQVTFTINNTFGNTDYDIHSDGIRIPLYGGYHITGYAYGGTGNYPLSFKIRVNGKDVKEIITTSVNSQRPIDLTLTLGKFDILSVYCRINSGSNSYVSAQGYVQLNITKL